MDLEKQNNINESKSPWLPKETKYSYLPNNKVKVIYIIC